MEVSCVCFGLGFFWQSSFQRYILHVNGKSSLHLSVSRKKLVLGGCLFERPSFATSCSYLAVDSIHPAPPYYYRKHCFLRRGIVFLLIELKFQNTGMTAQTYKEQLLHCHPITLPFNSI